jgi:sterol desaturase/sphingolipid hydroxylase (fatty acid hydroxylase superfamily)
MDIVNPLIFGVPFFVMLVGLEITLSRINKHHLYNYKDFFISIRLGIGASVIAVFTKLGALSIFFLIYEGLAVWRTEVLGYTNLEWHWGIWLIAIACDDVTFYWYHRLSHNIRLLWAAHAVHHSSRYYNYGTALRNGWFTLLYQSLFWLWMPALGFNPLMVATCISINSIYQFCLHTQLIPDLGVLEKMINTPKLHQVHHASNIPYLDKNHGGIFIIWDKLFGTYKACDPEIIPIYGLNKEVEDQKPLKLLTFEYQDIVKDVQRASSFRQKLKYIFYPPGWSHDHSTKTSKELQGEFSPSLQRTDPSFIWDYSENQIKLQGEHSRLKPFAQ